MLHLMRQISEHHLVFWLAVPLSTAALWSLLDLGSQLSLSKPEKSGFSPNDALGNSLKHLLHPKKYIYNQGHTSSTKYSIETTSRSATAAALQT